MDESSGGRVTKVNTSTPAPAWVGVIPTFIGAFICAVAANLIPTDESSIHAPRWVLFLCGLLFVLAGLAVLTENRNALSSIIPPFIVLGMGTIALWVSFYGDPQQMTEGQRTAIANLVATALSASCRVLE